MLSLFCYAVLCVLSRYENISLREIERKREREREREREKEREQLAAYFYCSLDALFLASSLRCHGLDSSE